MSSELGGQSDQHDASVTITEPSSDWDEVPIDFQYAGFVRRVAAFMIDYPIMFILQIVACLAIMIPIGMVVHLTEQSFYWPALIIGLVVGWLYFALMESSHRRGTLGKMAMRINVVDLGGNRVSFLRASARHLAKFISALGLVGFFIIDFNKQKQGMHDMMAKCLVVKKPSAGAKTGE